MRLLVTGGNGWIGRAVTAEALRRGHDVEVFDRATGGDVRDDGWLDDHVAGCETVIHLAGVLGTHELLDTPHLAVDVNVAGTLNVLEACRRHRAGYVGITMPAVNPSLYAATKQCARAMADAYHHAHGVAVSHVVAYNAFGAGQAWGEGHPQKIVPTFATRAWRGLPVPVWGDGDLLVDLVHVDDVARMLVDAVCFGGCEVFDAGTGKPRLVREVAAMVHAVAGDTGIEWLPPRPGERRQATDGDFAHGAGWDLLGWRPAFDVDVFAATVDSYRVEVAEVAA